MPLPLSRSQIDRLGKRLIAADKPTLADVERLNELLLAYREVLTEAVDRVEGATGLRPSSRIKTRGTTIDKLRRGRGSSLKMMQDLAGMRLVVGPTRAEQDAVVAKLVEEFSDGRKEPQVIDRRAVPSHGYRAVHVIVFPGDAQLEIQVRTRLQHEWAEVFEALADLVGRGIRYGEPADWPGVEETHRAEQAIVEAQQQVIDAQREFIDIEVSWMATLSKCVDILERKTDWPDGERDEFLSEFNESLAMIQGGIYELRRALGQRERPSS